MSRVGDVRESAGDAWERCGRGAEEVRERCGRGVKDERGAENRQNVKNRQERSSAKEVRRSCGGDKEVIVNS